MAWNVESQAKSGLGQLVWLKVAGPFSTEAEATMIADRTATRTGLPTRVVPAPRPPAAALDRVYDGRPCRRVPRPWHHQDRRSNAIEIEFADGARATVAADQVKRAAR